MITTKQTETEVLATFLNSLFPESLDAGFIEVRILSDLEKDRCYGQRWYSSPGDLRNDFQALEQMAAAHKACIAFSPALRREKSGKKNAVLGSWCLWNDQNQKDGGQEACLQRLRDDDLDWTIVNSGFAAHGYILLDQFCDDIVKLERANRLLQSRMGGDNVQDASRIMRLAGAPNFKDPSEVRVSSLFRMAEKRYNIDALIELLEEGAFPGDMPVDQSQVELLGKEARVAHQYDAVLKGMDAATLAMVFDAQPVGHRSEHDLAVANRLVAGDLDDDQIKGVFARYPCGAKAREGAFDKYLDRTISKARSNGHLYLPAKMEIPASPEGLRQKIGEIAASGKRARAIQEDTAQMILQFLDRHGKFFIDGTACHLHFGGKTYALSDNRPLRSLLQETCGLSLEHKEGQVTLDRLANHAYRHGQVATTRGPVFGNRSKHTIHVHSGGDGGKILRLAPGELTLVENGANNDHVCLIAPPEYQPFEFDAKVDVASAVEMYKSKLIDHLACDEIDRLTLMLWLPNVFLLDFSTVKIVVKMSGAQASGKTVASRLIGTLMAGSDIVKIRPTAPAIYADPLPIQILDNVENKDLRRSIEDIILFSATGGSREKMRLNTDAERIRHEINCLLLINGIEALDRSEILSRVYEVNFHRQFQSSGFLETDAADGVLAARNAILSGLLRLVVDHVLPRIVEGGIRDWKVKLDAAFPDHPKQRSFEFLARMGLVAEAIELVRAPGTSSAAAHEAAWEQIASILNRQRESAGEANAETNALAHAIHAIVKERLHWDPTKGTFPSRHHLDVAFENGSGKIVANAAELLYALEALSRHGAGRRLDVRNARSLAARLSSDQAILAECGIEVSIVGKQRKTNVYSIRIASGAGDGKEAD